MNADLVKQIKEITDKLETLPKEVNAKAMKKAIRPGANIIRDAAKANAPTDGTNPYTMDGVSLKESIKTFSLRKAKTSLFVGPKMPKSVRSGRVRTGYPYYAAWVEFGTRNMVGKAYLRRAYDANKDQALKAIQANVQKILKRWVDKNKI